MSKCKHKNRGFEGKKGLSVEVRNGNVDQAIRLLTKKVKQEGLMRELRQRTFFEKPSVVRRRKEAESKARWRKVRARMKDQ